MRGSYGEVGNDQIGGDRFLYLPSSYGAASDSGVNKYNFGLASNPYTSLMIVENKIGNPDLTWEKAKKMNVGVDINLFNNCLTASFDIFKEKRNNILANRSTSPMIIGANLPAYNFGEMENRGWEMDLNFRHHIQDFHYWARFNYSFARNEIIYMDEVQKRYDYQMTTGRRKNQFFGLIFDGYYNSCEEINALDRPKSSWSGNQLQPGDVKYIDVNQDGVIDDYDMVPIGYTPVPEIIYGFSFGAQITGIPYPKSRRTIVVIGFSVGIQRQTGKGDLFSCLIPFLCPTFFYQRFRTLFSFRERPHRPSEIFNGYIVGSLK